MLTWCKGHITFRKRGRGEQGLWQSQALPTTAIPRVSLSQNTHQTGRSGEETAGKGAGDTLLTPKAEPEELAVSPGGAAPPIEELSSSSEEDLPSSPEPPHPPKRPRRDLGSKGTKGGGGGPGGWTCGLCHSWFPERDEYVAHMKKEHGKVSRWAGGAALGLSCVAVGLGPASLALRFPSLLS